MNRSRLFILGLVSLVIGALVASYVSKSLLQSRNNATSQQGSDVVVAARDLQVGAKIEKGDVRTIKVSASELPAGIMRIPDAAVGRGVILPIGRGEFILPNKLADEKAGSGLPSLIPQGMRAVSVRVNEVVAVAGFVVPGTHVDVILTGNPAGSQDSVTTTVLENVLVLAAGQRLERNSSGDPQTVPVITLAVSPDDAQKLTLAAQQGHIQLSLRNPLDANQEKLLSVRNASLYRGNAPLEPAVKRTKKVVKATTPPAPQYYEVEVIRGDKKQITKF